VQRRGEEKYIKRARGKEVRRIFNSDVKAKKKKNEEEEEKKKHRSFSAYLFYSLFFLPSLLHTALARI
jgi:hypothetical protein